MNHHIIGAAIALAFGFAALPAYANGDWQYQHQYSHHGGELGPSSRYPRIHYWFPRLYNLCAYIRLHPTGAQPLLEQYPPGPIIIPAEMSDYAGESIRRPEVLPPPTPANGPELLPPPVPVPNGGGKKLIPNQGR